MSLSGIRDAIQTGLTTISGLKAYDVAPESVNQLPATWVIPKTGGYDFTASNTSMKYFFEVVLVVQRANLPSAQDALDAYIVPTGTSSIKAALEAADLSTHADILRVTGFRDYGGIEYAGIVYLGCKFDVEVWV